MGTLVDGNNYGNIEFTNRVFSKKTRRGRIALIAREHYLRDDVVCGVVLCATCAEKSKAVKTNSILREDASHYLIIDVNFAQNYWELIETPQLSKLNLIVLKTVTNEVQNMDGGQRLYNRIKNMLKDTRKNAILYSNEHSCDTFVERKLNESIEERNERAVVHAAHWYVNHLKANNIQIPIILVSDLERVRNQANSVGVKSLGIREYIQLFYKNESTSSLIELYESLYQIYLEKKERATSSNSSTSSNDLYEEYISDDLLEAGTKSGLYYRGVMHVNAHNPDEAYLHGDEQMLTSDIFIPEGKFRNRAIHGDTVAVQLLPENEWTSPSSSKKSNSESTNDEQQIVLSSKSRRKIPTGKVVGILQRNTRDYVCTIQLDKDKDISQMQLSKEKAIIVVPMDYRIPKIRIRTRQAVELLNDRIVVRIDGWDKNSNYPSGHYVYSLGEIGKLDTETQALLVENSVTISPFSQSMLTDLPDSSWKLPQEEINRRRDCRKDRVVSIDPLGSKDIDDALHVKRISKDKYEVAVHIADVNYFVKANSLLDVEARSRGTTVYLADRKYDMLPEILSEDLCSLKEGVDRCAVSVIWELNSNFEIQNTWFGRTAIHSAHSLYYELAQRIIDDSCTKEEKEKLPELRQDLRLLVRIARKIREDRLKRGALELESTEIRFQLGNNKDPINIIPKREQEINKVIAEYMILANEYVAERIYRQYPSAALLRHHPFPRSNRFEDVVKLAASRGFNIDSSSNKSLAKSLSRAELPSDPNFNRILKTLTTQAMEEAEYISTGSFQVDEFYHYGLAADYYTHFTSPIRRYADVMVHRQLLAALQSPPLVPLVNDLELSDMCGNLNRRHRASKQAQRDSTELFQSLYFKSREETVESVVYDVRSNGFMVFVPKYGIRGIVYLKDKEGNSLIPPNALSLDPSKYNSSISVSGYNFDEENQQILLNTSSGSLAVRLFDQLTVKITVLESRAHRPPMRFELVHFGANSLKSNEQNNKETIKQEMQKAIFEQEEFKRSLQVRVPEPALADYTLYAQTKEEDSLYATIEKLTELSLEDSPINSNSNQKDQTIRLWKLKKRERPKPQIITEELFESYEEVYDESEVMTDEQMMEKRTEIEERKKSKMPVEQRFHQQINQAELALKNMRKK